MQKGCAHGYNIYYGQMNINPSAWGERENGQLLITL